MKSGEYIWQSPQWPAWRYDHGALGRALADVHHAQGRLAGRLADFDLRLREEAAVQAFTADAVKTSEIEGEKLNPDSVRSSVARRLGVDIGALLPADRYVDGIVEVVLDATRHYARPLTADRLCGWQAALFPSGRSLLREVRVGEWRNDAHGPMQVVSGAYGREKVHFQAPPAQRLPAEMAAFLTWFEEPSTENPLVRAGLAHLWLVTIHPFEDGNGRVARAVGDMALARAEHSPLRYYSLSAQIQKDRETYYSLLEQTQKGSMEVTAWLAWFLDSLHRAIDAADATVTAVLAKAHFWQRFAGMPLNDRQIKMLNCMLDGGLVGALNNAKWVKMNQCSADTALRDIKQLLELGALKKAGDGGGRSTRYELA